MRAPSSLPPGTVTREALARTGSALRGDRLVRAGQWERAAPSTYLLPGAQLADRVAAALEHAGRDAVVTGWAACTLLGLPYVVEQPAVPVLVPAGRRRVSTPCVRVLPTTRPPAWVGVNGCRVAAPARAVVDAARALEHLRPVRALVLGALGATTTEALLAELHDGQRGGRALVGRALRDAAAGAASCPEAEAADLLAPLVRARRLPPFLLNADVLVDGVLLGRPDGWLPGLGLGWEVDSREHHAGDDAFEATLLRSDRFLAHGLPLLHVTPRRLREDGPAWRALLLAAARARRGAPLPAGLAVRPRAPLQPAAPRPRAAA